MGAAIKENHSYPCKHCGKPFMIMRTKTGSWLPVEWNGDKPPPGNEYDSSIHKSHLLNCKERQADWNELRKVLRDQEWEEKKRLSKILLR